MTHLFLITGARRGEILGLKWEDCDFDNNKVHICRNVQYSPDRGIYITTPKTKMSDRYISMPTETMKLLRQYKAWQGSERIRLGEYFEPQGFVFTQVTVHLSTRTVGVSEAYDNRLDEQILNSSLASSYQSSCVPAYNGEYTLFRRSGQCEYFKAARSCSGQHDGKYLRARNS